MEPIGDPILMSATQLADAIANQRTTSAATVDALLERIREHDRKLHAFTEVYAQDARRAAAAADMAIQSGHAVGPLHGMPIALKDLFEIKGRIVTDGCVEWRHRRATHTATLVKRLLAQGMIILGKTQMVEFALGGWGTNMHMGTPWNPWDLQTARAPGGSSSGSGVAVAARLSPWALGTDTGGSVRLPASFCGLTSLKVTAGRISTYGILPLSPTLDTPGPMARSAEDAELLYRAMLGPDSPARPTLAAPAGGNRWSRHNGMAGLRLACLSDGDERAKVSHEVLAAYDRSLDQLSDLGADIQPVELPFRLADIAALNGRIMSAESYAILADTVDDENLQLDDNVRPRIQSGRDISAHAYLSTLAQGKQMRQAFQRTLGDCEALLTPTTTTTAPPLEAIDPATSASHFTRVVNFLELCALALPNGMDAEGLPTSLQIIGRPFAEETLLGIGRVYQTATEWHKQRPPQAQ